MTNAIARRRLYLTADRQRAVSASNPEAAFLLVHEGGEIPADVAERYNIVGGDVEDEPASNEAPGGERKARVVRNTLKR